VDLLKGEHGSSNKTCVTSTLVGNTVTSIEAERVCHVTEEEDQEPTTIPAIKTEPIESCVPVNSMDLLKGELGRKKKRPVWKVGKPRPIGIRSPDCPARSQSTSRYTDCALPAHGTQFIEMCSCFDF
jgi:hypothetical protein